VRDRVGPPRPGPAKPASDLAGPKQVIIEKTTILLLHSSYALDLR